MTKISTDHIIKLYDLKELPFLMRALEIPYCHHENWAGYGYPQKLKEKEIPLSARIFSVVDVWDAMRSDRPYRPAMGKNIVHEYIQDQSGKRFDPEVVVVFLKLVELGKIK